MSLVRSIWQPSYPHLSAVSHSLRLLWIHVVFRAFLNNSLEVLMIAVGSEAPDFKLASQFDSEYSLSEFKGKKNVMLVFYPFDWSATWSREIPKIESMIDRFKEADTQVLGVSIDSKHSHKKWAESLGGVSYPLLQDFHPKGSMATSYGTYLENKGFAARSTVIVDKQGSVRYSVMANGERIITELLNECQKING